MAVAKECQLQLQFFDVGVRIWSDSAEYLTRFNNLYRRFQVNAASHHPTQLDFKIITGAKHPPQLILNGVEWPLPDTVNLRRYIYGHILKTILNHVRSHLLFHAAVVASEDGATLIVADSFHGKTTLSLALVQRGFSFLTDETAALGRADGRIYPCLRQLSVRDGSLAQSGFGEHAVALHPTDELGKQIIDIDVLKPSAVGEAQPLKQVIVLHDLNRPKVIDEAYQLTIILNNLPEALENDIRELDDVVSVEFLVTEFVKVQLEVRRRTAVFDAIEQLCDVHNVLLLDVVDKMVYRPNFDSPVELTPIAKSEAVAALLERFQGGYKSVILQDEYGGNTMRLFIELARLLGDADCYRLSVGDLNEMCDSICAL